VYDKLLKPRQSFLITLYFKGFGWVGLKERDRLEDRDINGGYIEMGWRGLNITQDRVVGGLLET
jgi:hypothetical protein